MRKLLGTVFLSFACLGASSAFATEITFNQGLAQGNCKEAWTKRGKLDSDMFNYCMKKQSDGYAEALQLYNKYSNIEPVELIDDVVTFALNKWATPKEYDLGMVAYEIEQHGEAYLNIAYEVNSGNLSEQKLEECKNKWISASEPDWNMVEYCSKK